MRTSRHGLRRWRLALAARDLRRRITTLEANAPATRLIRRPVSPEALGMLERQADRLIAEVPEDPDLWTGQHLAAIGAAADFHRRACALRMGADPDVQGHRLTEDSRMTLAVARILQAVGAG